MALLTLKGVQFLTTEKQLPSKRIDLYFEVREFGSRRRYAVECKRQASPLTKLEIDTILASYLGTLNAAEVTNLLIVGAVAPSPTVRSYVDSIPYLSFMTVAELRNSVIEFTGYLSGLEARFKEDPVWNYYIPAQGVFLNRSGHAVAGTGDGGDANLHGALANRLGRGEGPFVVLGAYGIGKTTLAKRLFLRLLTTLRAKPLAPIPIYISLDRLQHEQSIEGLIGTLFTSIAPCPGYNFDLFSAMHASGHFVLIFDGIDEMRHRMSKEEFLYNIDQIGILVNSSPRGVVLGRIDI